MTRLVLALTRADLRAAPGRAATVAVLLAAAALLPSLLSVDPLVGVALAVGIAGAATAGATAQHRRRHEVLFLNGAPPGIELRLVAAAMVVPGAAAAVVAGGIGLLRGAPSHAAAGVVLALVVPVAVAPASALLHAPRAPSRRRTVTVVVVVVLLTPTIVVPLGALAVLIGRRLSQAGLAGRMAGAAVAVSIALGAAVLAGLSETWFDLAAILAVVALPLGLSIAWLGSSAVGGAGWVARRMGPVARLATAPLSERRVVLAPVVALVALVTSVAVLEGVVGASFGAREAGRDRVGVVLGTVGSRPDQAVVVTSVDLPAGQVRELAYGAAADSGLQVAVIDRLGSGGTEVDGPRRPASPFPPGVSFEVPPTWRLAGTEPPSPSWVGVATPDDLRVLGLGEAADALSRGAVVVLAEDGIDGGRARLRGPDGGPDLPAVPARLGNRPALGLPAALVSPAVAAELGSGVRGGRAVFTPGDGPATEATLLDVASRFGDVLRFVAPSEDSDPDAGPYSSPDVAALVTLEARRPAALGDEVVRSNPGGELNAVPFLSRTWDAGRGEAIALGALALLVALAGTVLALGGSRADDAVLDARARRGASGPRWPGSRPPC